MGLEKLHPFDAGKWGKVIHFLKEEQFITDGNIVEAREAAEEDLLVVHTKRYLNRLKVDLFSLTCSAPFILTKAWCTQMCSEGTLGTWGKSQKAQRHC
uniref:Histone deacetylase 11 n=1 Tax=Amphilophus citrinellus TaxID=61819 RepID=A0A3Q0R2P1_AMPCI